MDIYVYSVCVSVVAVFLLLVLFLEQKKKKKDEEIRKKKKKEKEKEKEEDDKETAARVLVALNGFIYDVTQGSDLFCPGCDPSGDAHLLYNGIEVTTRDDFKREFLYKNYRYVGTVDEGEHITIDQRVMDEDQGLMDESDATTNEGSNMKFNLAMARLLFRLSKKQKKKKIKKQKHFTFL